MSTNAAECDTLFQQILAEADEMVAAQARNDRAAVSRAKDRLFIATKRLAARSAARCPDCGGTGRIQHNEPDHPTTAPTYTDCPTCSDPSRPETR